MRKSEKLSTKIEQIIKKRLNIEVPFEQLRQFEKRDILSYVERHNISDRIFTYRGYDVISNTFFVKEYVSSDEYESLDNA